MIKTKIKNFEIFLIITFYPVKIHLSILIPFFKTNKVRLIIIIISLFIFPFLINLKFLSSLPLLQ